MYHDVNSRGKDAIKLKEVHIRWWRCNLSRNCNSWNHHYGFFIRDLLPIRPCFEAEVARKAFIHRRQTVNFYRLSNWTIRELDQMVCTDRHHLGNLSFLGWTANSEMDLGKH